MIRISMTDRLVPVGFLYGLIRKILDAFDILSNKLDRNVCFLSNILDNSLIF